MSKLNKNSKRIHAISFVDISYSWGPAIHFVELWNEFSVLSDIEVTGYAVVERNNRPYTKINFKLKYLDLADNQNIIKRRLAKYLYDFYLFITFIFLKPTRVYIRQSKFGLFLVLALFIRRHEVYIEMNGLAKEDNTNSMSKSGYFKRLYCNLMELLYVKLPGVKVISVANKISSTIRRRYSVNNTYSEVFVALNDINNNDTPEENRHLFSFFQALFTLSLLFSQSRDNIDPNLNEMLYLASQLLLRESDSYITLGENSSQDIKANHDLYTYSLSNFILACCQITPATPQIPVSNLDNNPNDTPNEYYEDKKKSTSPTP